MNITHSQSHYSSHSDLYLGPGYNNLPGISNSILAPPVFFESIKATDLAYEKADKEGMIQNAIRVISTPLAFIHSLLQLNWYVIEGGTLLNLFSTKVSQFLRPLERQGSILGLIAAVFELFLEGHFLHKQITFSNRFLNSKIDSSSPKELLKKFKEKYFDVSPKRIEKINSYIQKHFKNAPLHIQEENRNTIIEQSLLRNKEKLIRRIRPWLVEKLEQQLPQIASNLESVDPNTRAIAINQSIEIYQEIKAQSKKQLILTSIAIAAISLVIIGITLSFIASLHFLIPFIIIMVGGGLDIIRSVLHNGLLDHSGWDFDVQACIPNQIKKIYAFIQKEWNYQTAWKKSTYMPKTYYVLSSWQNPASIKTSYVLTIPPANQ